MCVFSSFFFFSVIFISSRSGGIFLLHPHLLLHLLFLFFPLVLPFSLRSS